MIRYAQEQLGVLGATGKGYHVRLRPRGSWSRISCLGLHEFGFRVQGLV